MPDKVQDYEAKVFTRDMYFMALINDYVAVELGDYYSTANLEIEGCLITDMRTLSSSERNEFIGQTEDESGHLSDEELKEQCHARATEFGLYTQTELDFAMAESMAAGIADGITACQNSPAEYGLFSSDDMTQAFDNGQQSCKDDPASCGLFDNQDLTDKYDEGLSDGKQSCQNDPASCNLLSEADLNDGKNDLLKELINELTYGQIIVACIRNRYSLICQNRGLYERKWRFYKFWHH